LVDDRGDQEARAAPRGRLDVLGPEHRARADDQAVAPREALDQLEGARRVQRELEQAHAAADRGVHGVGRDPLFPRPDDGDRALRGQELHEVHCPERTSSLMLAPVLRNALLWASTNRFLRERAMRARFVRRSVARFMPGEDVDDALAAARGLRGDRLNTILTHLGENLATLEEAAHVRDHYLDVIERVRAAGLDAHISVKPTQLGLDHDEEVCFEHCAALLGRCFLWLDMESSPYVDRMLALYRRLRARSEKVGVAIQAYLRRTDADIAALVDLGAAIRLVKGAYLEPPEVAYPRKADVDAAYFRLGTQILQAPARPGA